MERPNIDMIKNTIKCLSTRKSPGFVSIPVEAPLHVLDGLSIEIHDLLYTVVCSRFPGVGS